MLGFIILFVVLGLEVGFMVYCLRTKGYQKHKKSILRIASFALIVFMAVIGVINWGFQWYLLTLILFIKALIGIINLMLRNKRKVKTYKKKYVIMSGITGCFLFGFALIPTLIFPQFRPIEATGEYEIQTVSYTLTDSNRKETFSDLDENRKVTIQFWYPENAKETFPLVVFSHGSFGFRGSNESTFEDLASNGYVVCSIDHTYHAFFTKQTDGNTIIANMDFVNGAVAVTNEDYDGQTIYELTQEWLNLRVGDMNFVLDDILKKVGQSEADNVYRLIDAEKIGLFGHSMGGATAAELGRTRNDIDAAIVVDGTMLGEEIGFENGQTLVNQEPYPIPLLNMYNEDHYQDAEQMADVYANTIATANAVDAMQVVIKGSGHLNFTDLPMFSPMLAGLLGTGEVDSRYCIETMNQIVLEYFDYYLKDSKELKLELEY